MIKKNKFALILTSLVTIIPIFAGLLLWQKLPEQMPIHWNIDGQVDNWASKPVAVFCMPLFMLAAHWACILASAADPKNKHYHPKAIQLVLWICPTLSLIIFSFSFAVALGYKINVGVIMCLLVGLMFLIVGNLLPKMRQSYTIGIRLPWTLHNEENWNQTHRFGGKIWAAGGVFIMSTAFLGNFWILAATLALMCIAPTLYSYILYRRQSNPQKGA